MREIKIPLDSIELSPQASRFIDLAESHVESFRDELQEDIPSFICCDFRMVARALQWMRDEYVAPGDNFCEWGCGLGVVTSLAQLVGFDALGIEIEPSLCDAAGKLARAAGIRSTFFNGSFLPHEAEGHVDDAYIQGDGSFMQRTIRDETFERWDGEMSEFDALFVYPWPDDEDMIESIFEEFAAEGAVLLTYRATKEVYLHRK